VSAGRHRVPPDAFQDLSSPLVSIDLHLSRPYHLEWKKGPRYCRTHMVAGALCLIPAGQPVSMRWADTLEILRVSLSPTVLTGAADSLNLRGEIEIPERHGDFDTQIAHLCQALWSEAQAGYPLGRLFGESLGTALAACLLKRYGQACGLSSAPGKLSPRAWKQLRQFVEEHLGADISLEDMAQIARLSPYHFSRCFKETAGTSPHQYLIARRVQRAQELLTDSNLSLSDVARQSGFADQSHLSRHMKRLLGVTPKSLVPPRNNRKIVR
jgi:AraC family transcriptional regulator